MSYYIVYPVDNVPAAMLARHPTPAMYTVKGKSFYVFGESLEDITGMKDATVDDIKGQGFNHTFKEGAPGLTAAQLKANVNSRISQGTSFEVSRAQGRYMWEEEWKPLEEII